MKLKILIIISLCITFVNANIEVLTKKDVKAVNKGIVYLEKQKKDELIRVKLKRYLLVKQVEKPSFFSSSAPIYDLYLASFLQKGTPLWLTDNKFVFHTSSSQWYMKKLKKIYYNKYNIEVVVYKNPNYKEDTFKLTEVDNDELVEYLQKKIPKVLPEKFAKKEKKVKKKEKLVEKKKLKTPLAEETVAQTLPIIPSKVLTKKEAKNLQEGIDVFETEIGEATERIELKRYFLAKFVEKPSFFSDKKPFYNLYLTAMIHKGTPAWLEDTKFVFHTSSSQKYLKRIKKLYKKKYNLDLVLYKNLHYKKETLVLAKTDKSKILSYLQTQVPEALVQEIVEDKEYQVLKQKKRVERLKKRRVIQKQKLKRERKRAEKERRISELQSAKRKKQLAKERKKAALKKALLEKKKRKSVEKKKRLDKQKKEAKQNKALSTERDETQRKRALEEKAWAEKKKELEEEKRKSIEKKKRLDKQKKEAKQNKALSKERDEAKRKRALEEKAWAEKKKELEEERKAFEKEKRLLEEKEIAREKRRLEKRKKEAARLKKLASEKEKAEKERKKAESKKWAAKKKKLEAERKRAASKVKKKDNLTSDIDKMMKDTVDFKKKLERSESIKYY